MSLNNIPAELKALPQWVCWRHHQDDARSKPTKMPFNPKTGKLASNMEPSHWGSFAEAVAAMAERGYDGIGFVLTEQDPYCIIDLDNKPTDPCTPEQLERHTKIYETFQSYTELSVSGTGIHIVVRGKVPSGKNFDHVEVYSSGRYMVFTGNVLRDLPIVDMQPILDILHAEIEKQQAMRAFTHAGVELEELEEEEADWRIVERASEAANGEKFDKLCRGEWQDEYPSQSEADFALLSIIAFYTKSNEQVRRIFRCSELGKREKAQKDAPLNFALRKIRGQQMPEIDMSAIQAQAEAMRAESKAAKEAVKEVPPAPPVEDEDTELDEVLVRRIDRQADLPPGLMGDIARYIYATAHRPVPELALAASIGLMAGIAGRAFNVSGTGLNHYIIALAKTGTGKDGMEAGIDKLIAALRDNKVLNADTFIGPTFASGQALGKTLAGQPCFLSIYGEIGFTLQRWADPRTNASEKMIKQFLLQLYGKSGWGNMVKPLVAVGEDKSIGSIHAPSLSILGESTQEVFFEKMDQSQIMDGLIPRFTIVEYTGERPPRNKEAGAKPPAELTQRLTNLVHAAATAQNDQVVTEVQIAPDALTTLDRFDNKVDNIMRKSNNAISELWNRAHVKSLKLAALVAVGINPNNPIITKEIAKWAIDFNIASIETIAKRFTTGDVGSGDSKQVSELRRITRLYFDSEFHVLAKYGVTQEMWDHGAIPYIFYQRRMAGITCFNLEGGKATQAIRRTIESFVNMGILVKLNPAEVLKKYKYHGECYGVADRKLLD